MADLPARTVETLERLVAARYDGDEAEARQMLDNVIRRIEWRKRNGGKRCDVCRQVKPVGAFGQDATRPDGLRRQCRRCRARRR